MATTPQSHTSYCNTKDYDTTIQLSVIQLSVTPHPTSSYNLLAPTHLGGATPQSRWSYVYTVNPLAFCKSA